MKTRSTILMIQPVNFKFNNETAENNYFQISKTKLTSAEIQKSALIEFRNFRKKLIENKINIISISDTLTPAKPDSIFPNNWVSFHEDGTVVLYPMFSKNRRLERRKDIIENLQSKYGFYISKIIDYSCQERYKKYLEGTGSLVIDYDNGIVYANVSVRTNSELVKQFCVDMKFEPVIFNSFDSRGRRIYHTNVMMCVGNKFVVICLESVKDREERKELIDTIKQTGKELVEISFKQMEEFAGNMLEIYDNKKKSVLIMSDRAYRSLKEGQIKYFESVGKLVYVNINTIEQIGGGSARCMLADVRLPKKKLV